MRRALVLHGDNLSQRVVHGASFTLLGIVLRTLITLGSVAILARLLSPADFGYMTMAVVVTELAALFGNFGFASVLIQKRVITRLQMDTVFWSSALLGLLLTTTVFGLSYLAVWLFGEALPGQLMRIMCLTFVIDGLAVVHGALISRLMHFQADFWIQILSVAFRTATAIVFAWQGFGVWSLAIGALAGSILRVLLSVLVIPYWPRLKFNVRYLRSTWKTNSSYFASGLLFYIHMSADLLLIGRALGATPLGYYQNARSLTDEVRSRISFPLQRILFPAFSSLQENTAWLQTSVLRSSRLLAAIVFPVGIGIAAIADDLVPILYGEKWLAMIPLLKLLGINTALRGSTAISTPLFNAQNKVSLALRFHMADATIVLVSVWIASAWGIEAVAGAVTVCGLFSLLTYRAGLGLIGLGWRAVWAVLSPPVLASLGMWIAVEAASAFATSHWTTGARLASHILLGMLVYPLALALIAPIFLADIKSVFDKFRPSAKPA